MKIGSVKGIPVLGFGTYPLRGEEAIKAVSMAVEAGFRHIDTAQMYGNEKDVGRALQGSGLARKDLFVVTKVDPGKVSEERFANSVAKSVDDLGGPVDLLLVHWPPPQPDLTAVLDRMMAAKDRGLTRAIGVSNFSPNMMRRGQLHTSGAIAVNQVEFHPLLDQRAVLDTARELGIAISAFSPLARGRAMQADAVQAIAQRLGKLASEIVLAWILQQGVIAIPMTTKRENALSNLNAMDLRLSAEDMAAIAALGSEGYRTVNPSWMAGRWGE